MPIKAAVREIPAVLMAQQSSPHLPGKARVCGGEQGLG